MTLTICVYCASGTREEKYIELAHAVGTEIGRRGWHLVSGGGNVSMMGAVATSVRAAGGRTIGVIPRALVRREVADTDSDELVITNTMRERKQIMDDHADAFITLPGGLGTLEELFETWTAGYLGMHDKPIVLLDPFGHYDGLFTWLRDLRRHRFVNDVAFDRLIVTADVGAALDACLPSTSEETR